MLRLPVFLAALLGMLLVSGGPLGAKSECESCKDLVSQLCKILDDVRSKAKKQPSNCVELGNQRCASKCKDEEPAPEPVGEEDEPAPTPEDPAPTPDEPELTPDEPVAEKMEDHPCYMHCASTCGGPTAEAQQACVLECLQTTSCRPQ